MKDHYQKLETAEDKEKRKIVKYTACALLAGSILLCQGFVVNDKNAEHNNDIQPTYEYNIQNDENKIVYCVPVGYVLGYDESGKPFTIKVIGELADSHYHAPAGYIAVKKTNGEIGTIKYNECDIYADGYKIIQVQEKLCYKYYAVKTNLTLDSELSEEESLSK